MSHGIPFFSSIYSPQIHHFDPSPFELASQQFERLLPARIIEIRALQTEALQEEKAGTLFADVIDSGLFRKIAFLIEELPQKALSAVFETQGKELFPRVDDSHKSMWLYCVEAAAQKKQPQLLATLLGLFEKFSKENTEENIAFFTDNAIEAIKMLTQDGIDQALQFLFELSSPLQKNVLLELPGELKKLLFGAQPEKLLSKCLEERFSFFIDFIAAHLNDEMISKGYCRALVSKWTQGDHFALVALLKPLSEKGRRELFASWPAVVWQQLVETPGGTTFLHFLAQQNEATAWQIAQEILESMPFEACIHCIFKKDAAGIDFYQYLAAPARPKFAELIKKKVQAALDQCASSQSLSLKSLRSFLLYALSLTQREELYALISLVNNPGIASVRGHMDKIRAIMHQYGLDCSRLVTLKFATCLTEGAASLSELKTLRKELIGAYKTIVEPTMEREELVEKIASFTKELNALLETMIETSLAALDGKSISLDDIRPFLGCKLTKNSFMRLIGLARASGDAAIQNAMKPLDQSKDALQKLNALMQKEQNHVVNWADLETIIPFLPEIDDAEVTAFVKLLEKAQDVEIGHLVTRFKTLMQSIGREVASPSYPALLREAYYIEKTIPKIVSSQDEVFRRRDTKLPHTLQVNPKTGMICILPRQSRARWSNNGSYKIATNGWAVLKDRREAFIPIARLITRMPTPSNELVFPQLFDHMRAEVAIMKHFGAGKTRHPGFNCLLSCAEYPIRHIVEPNVPPKEFPRMSMCVDLAQSTLHQYAYSAQQPVLAEQIRFIKESLDALRALHAEGIVHGDIKPKNIILAPAANNELHAQLIDFGFSQAVEKNVPLDTQQSGSRYNDGFYGSISYTAPELLGQKNFSGDHYKVDAFALGYTMFELYYHGHASWGPLIDAMYQKQDDADFIAQQKEIVLEQIDSFVSKVISAYGSAQNSPQLAPDWVYQYTMAMLLHPDPNTRWGPEQALRELSRTQL